MLFLLLTLPAGMLNRPLPAPACLLAPACLQWSSKAFEVREACTKIYNAARAVLSAIHDVKLE